MADDKTKRGPQDRAKVNFSEDYEVAYWTKKCTVSKAQLREAVKKAGSSGSDAVARALGKMS